METNNKQEKEESRKIIFNGNCNSCGIHFYYGYDCPQCGYDHTPEVRTPENVDCVNLREIRSNLKSVKIRGVGAFESAQARAAVNYIKKEIEALEDYTWQVQSNIEHPSKPKLLNTTRSDKAKLELLADEVGAMVWLIPKTESKEVTRTVDDVQGLIRKIKRFVVKRISEL